jgi:hypothetical protein
MKLLLLDEKGLTLGDLAVDFDELLIEAEGHGGNVFNAASMILNENIKQKFQRLELSSSSFDSLEKNLRRIAASGDDLKPVSILVSNRKGENDKMTQLTSSSFEAILRFPDSQVQYRYDRLVGLDTLKKDIEKEAAVIIDPTLLENWSRRYHGSSVQALKTFHDRYPFFIFEGDVGTGKTEFAETFGSALASRVEREVWLARMSMKSRGNGVVGEMSKLISKAFQDAKEMAVKTKTPGILLLDEADSLAQSREENQMHHEDRAGVNALIQGIDHLRESIVPVLVVFCTNRLGSIDPAIKRRAAIVFTFTRPNLAQRKEVFRTNFKELKLSEQQVDELGVLTGENANIPFGFTYSDLFTRLIPKTVLNAYPDRALSYEILVQTLKSMHPTSPFVNEAPTK